MNEYNEYFKNLNKIYHEKRSKEIENLSFRYLNIITKEIKNKKYENGDFCQISVNLGQCNNYPYNITYNEIINNIKGNIDSIHIYANSIDTIICNNNEAGFLGFYPKKCHNIKEIIANVRWD